MRVTSYQDGKYEIGRLFICPACYAELLARGEEVDTHPLLTQEDAGYPCDRCGATTEG